ncbi:MAG: fibronectin type III domain-containing protein, partial [Chloroflexota bacterium]
TPLPPYIKFSKAVKNGAELHIMATDKEAGGVRVYRNDGKSAELYAVSDLLRIPDSLVVVYFDTTSALSGRTTYIYAVKTESTSFVESPLSEKVYIRPLITKPPREPYELTAYEEDGHVRLFWENMQDNDLAIAGYTLKRKDLNSKTASFIEMNEGGKLLNLNYYTDSTAKPGTAYAYQVNSVDIDGNISKGGSIASVSLQQEIPAQPFALRAYRSDEGIYLQWSRTLYPDIQSVNLYRYEKGTKPVLLMKLPSDAVEYTDATAPQGKMHFYYVTTMNKNGMESVPSEEIAVE